MSSLGGVNCSVTLQIPESGALISAKPSSQAKDSNPFSVPSELPSLQVESFLLSVVLSTFSMLSWFRNSVLSELFQEGCCCGVSASERSEFLRRGILLCLLFPAKQILDVVHWKIWQCINHYGICNWFTNHWKFKDSQSLIFQYIWIHSKKFYVIIFFHMRKSIDYRFFKSHKNV